MQDQELDVLSRHSEAVGGASVPAHTPGPWSVYGDDPIIILRADGCSLGEMSAGAPDVSHSEQIANTRLAAAAPDLLEALWCARLILSRQVSPNVYAMADAAIAKALGPSAPDTTEPQDSPGIDHEDSTP